MTRITKLVALAALATVAFHSQATTSQAASNAKKQSFASLLNLQQDNFAAKTTSPSVSGVRASYVATAARNGVGAIRATAAGAPNPFLRYFTNQYRLLLRAENALANSELRGLRQLLNQGFLTRDQFNQQRYIVKLAQLNFNTALNQQFAAVVTQLSQGIIPPATSIRGS